MNKMTLAETVVWMMDLASRYGGGGLMVFPFGPMATLTERRALLVLLKRGWLVVGEARHVGSGVLGVEMKVTALGHEMHV